MNSSLINTQIEELCHITPQHALFSQSVEQLILSEFITDDNIENNWKYYIQEYLNDNFTVWFYENYKFETNNYTIYYSLWMKLMIQILTINYKSLI